MKKRILAVTLSAFMAVSLSACSTQLSNEYITINKYEGLEVAKVETVEVTDDDVEYQIENNLSLASVTEEVKDRAAESGDTANIDYTGSVDNVEFAGGAAAGVDLVLGSDSFIGAEGDYKGFEEQIVGHKSGESFDITVKFPDEYGNEELNGKVAKFAIKLNSISVVKTPELTDDWVADNSETSKTVEEYKAEVKTSLEETNQESIDSSLQNSVLTALLEQIEVKSLPEEDVEAQLATINEYYNGMAQSYGMEFKDFAEQVMGMTEEEYNKQAQTATEQAITRKLACQLIAKKKGLEPSQKEYDELIAEYAQSSGYENTDDFIETVGEDVLKDTILQQKVAEYLAEKCVQVETTEATE